jgi:hypothetical protein
MLKKGKEEEEEKNNTQYSMTAGDYRDKVDHLSPDDPDD